MCDGGVKSALSFAVQRSRRIAKRAKRGEKRELWRVRPNQTKKARNTIDTGFVPKDATLAIGIRHSNGTFGSFFFFFAFPKWSYGKNISLQFWITDI